jgi:hypothetical protein
LAILDIIHEIKEVAKCTLGIKKSVSRFGYTERARVVLGNKLRHD